MKLTLQFSELSDADVKKLLALASAEQPEDEAPPKRRRGKAAEEPEDEAPPKRRRGKAAEEPEDEAPPKRRRGKAAEEPPKRRRGKATEEPEGVTLDDVRAVLRDFAAAFGNKDLTSLMAAYGAVDKKGKGDVSLINPEDYEDIMSEAREELEE
jgi:hypothetical protein